MKKRQKTKQTKKKQKKPSCPHGLTENQGKLMAFQVRSWTVTLACDRVRFWVYWEGRIIIQDQPRDWRQALGAKDSSIWV